MLLQTLAQRAEKQGLGRLRFHASALKSLQMHPWPGNVRELSNLVERLAIMHPEGVVGISELPLKCRLDSFVSTENVGAVDEAPVFAVSVPSLVVPTDGMDLKQYIDSIEKALIRDALDKTGFVVAQAAVLLMIRRTTLVEKMRKFGIQRVSDK